MSEKGCPRTPQPKSPGHGQSQSQREAERAARMNYINTLQRQLRLELEQPASTSSKVLLQMAEEAAQSTCKRRTEESPPPRPAAVPPNSLLPHEESFTKIKVLAGRPMGQRPNSGPPQQPRPEQRPEQHMHMGHGAGGHGSHAGGGSGSAEQGPHDHHGGGLYDMAQQDPRAAEALAHLSQLKKTPSYILCTPNQDLNFNPCRREEKQGLPLMPIMMQEELEQLIRCEEQDVESARYLAMEQRRTYKKPCPKQQKAQMSMKALVQAYSSQSCGWDRYPPLDTEPEDISPDMAASIMFSQEEGIKMDGCPKDTISRLFPDEPKQAFPGKSSISMVDQGQRERDELIERSASVPSEGVSDSAYTRTMKGKSEDLGAQKSYDVDFAIGQSKREYVLVAPKPHRFNKVQVRGNLPPWFPGYFSAFPDDDGGLKVVSSLSGLFHKAWTHTNPKNIPASDMIVTD